MNTIWLHQNNSNKLILFFNGWGCDERPFQHMLASEYNVLMLNDYKELVLSDEVLEAIHHHDEVHVVAWSFGVWVAQCLLMPLKQMISSATAINGTLEPVSVKHGIPEPIALGTLSGLTDANLLKFQRRMLRSKEAWQRFEQVKPKRELEEVKNELFLLLQHFKVQKPGEGFYSGAIIGSDDLIMPVENQKAYWDSCAPVIELKQPHFCFFEFNSWTDILELNASIHESTPKES